MSKRSVIKYFSENFPTTLSKSISEKQPFKYKKVLNSNSKRKSLIHVADTFSNVFFSEKKGERVTVSSCKTTQLMQSSRENSINLNYTLKLYANLGY